MDRLKVATAGLCGALVACLVYAGDRTWAALTVPGDPRNIVATVHVDYFWRVAMAAFVGSLAALVFAYAVRDVERARGRLVKAAPLVVGVVAMLAAAFP